MNKSPKGAAWEEKSSCFKMIFWVVIALAVNTTWYRSDFSDTAHSSVVRVKGKGVHLSPLYPFSPWLYESLSPHDSVFTFTSIFVWNILWAFTLPSALQRPKVRPQHGAGISGFDTSHCRRLNDRLLDQPVASTRVDISTCEGVDQIQ